MRSAQLLQLSLGLTLQVQQSFRICKPFAKIRYDLKLPSLRHRLRYI